jgi:MFS family permease
MGSRVTEPRRGLVARSPAFAALLGARALSVAGDGIGTVALVIYVVHTRGSGSGVGLLLLVVALPSLLSPLTGVVADRYDRRLVLAASEIAQGLIAIVIVVWLPSFELLLLLVYARAMAATIGEPAGRSAVPSLVDDGDLTRANALLGSVRQVADVLGPLFGGFLVAAGGVRAGLAVDAASFFVAAPLLLRLPALAPRGAGADATVPARPTVRMQSGEGLRYVVHDPVARAAAVGFFFIGFTAADDVALPFLAHTLGAGDIGVGLLYAAAAFGLVLGYLSLVRSAAGRSVTTSIVLGAALLGIGNGLTGIAQWVALAAVFQIVRGIGAALFDANVQTMLQRSVSPELLGRVMANVYGAVNVAAAIAVVLGGLLLDVTSARVVLVSAGAAGVFASVAVYVLLRNR